MTTEEIDKAVKDYADNSTLDSYLLLKLDFRNGIDFANKHWQEKTRWIPVEERLPEARETPYFIAIKYKVAESDSDNIGAICIYDKTDVDYILLEGITHWKEIEL